MINLPNSKNNTHLQNYIAEQGYSIKKVDNFWKTSNDGLVQIIIDNFDPLPEVKAESKQQVKDASAKKRLQYITQAAGKDAEYKTKEAEAEKYEIDGTVGVFMQARIDKTGEGSIAVGLEWSAKAESWKAIGAEIAAIEDKAAIDIDNCTDWLLCESIAKSAIESFDLV
jgi:hypothetical protein